MTFLVIMIVLAAVAFIAKTMGEQKINAHAQATEDRASTLFDRIAPWARARGESAADYFAIQTLRDEGWYALMFLSEWGEQGMDLLKQVHDLVRGARNPEQAEQIARLTMGLSPTHFAVINLLATLPQDTLGAAMQHFRASAGPQWDDRCAGLVFEKWPAPAVRRDGRWGERRYNQERLSVCCEDAFARARQVFATLPSADTVDWAYSTSFTRGDGEKVAEPIARFRTTRAALAETILTGDPVADAAKAFKVTVNRSEDTEDLRPLPDSLRWKPAGQARGSLQAS